jgi:uncharacterized protein YkwD
LRAYSNQKITAIRILGLCLILCAFKTDKDITIHKEEAQKAFVLLTDIRNNPNKYCQELNFEKDLKTSSVQLKWNETLAEVAERKAFDMANRNYFSHVDPDGFGINYYINKSGYSLNADWIRDKSANYFESIIVNAQDGQDAIKRLILDIHTPSLGHRNHLLGLNQWSASLTDIGIGFIKCDFGCSYKTYVTVIIAKHNW